MNSRCFGAYIIPIVFALNANVYGLNGSVVSGKILVLAILAILGQNTLLVVTLFGFRLFLAIFFQTVDNFLLIFTFKLSLLFRMVQMSMKIFILTKKIGVIFGPLFGPKFGHFRSKIRFSDIYFETTHQICLKLGQKLGTIALNHRMAVLCQGKLLFWPFLGKKYIACGDIYMVLGCFGHFLPNR